MINFKKLADLSAILCLTLAATALNAGDVAIVGYGSSDAVLPAKNQELFYMGFDLAIKSSLDHRYGKSAVTVDQVNDRTDLGAVRAARELIARGVRMIVGFPSSHEAILASQIAVKIPVLALFINSGAEKLAQMGNYIFSTAESPEYSVRTMLEYIQQQKHTKKGLLITNPKAIYSLNQTEIIRRIRSRSPAQLLPNLDAADVGVQLTLPDALIAKMKSGEYDFLILTQYANESDRLLQQLENSGIDLPIYAPSSWTDEGVDFLRRLLTHRKSETYSLAAWIPGTRASQPIEKSLKAAYGREPTAEMVYGYDAGLIVAQTLNHVSGVPTAESIHQSFLAQKCFSGVSVGQICFSSTGGNANRKVTVVHLLNDRFVPVPAVDRLHP